MVKVVEAAETTWDFSLPPGGGNSNITSRTETSYVVLYSLTVIIMSHKCPSKDFKEHTACCT